MHIYICALDASDEYNTAMKNDYFFYVLILLMYLFINKAMITTTVASVWLPRRGLI